MFRGSGLRRRIVTGFGLAIVGVLGVFVAVAVAGGWSSSVTYLSSDTGTQTQEAPAAALSPNGDVAALWLDDNPTDTTAGSASLVGRSDDGGGFGTVQTIGAADPLQFYDSDYPQITQDATGDAVAVWLDNGNVMAGYRAAGAASYTVSTLDDASALGNQDNQPMLAMDAKGDAVVVWEQQNGQTGDWSVEYAVRAAGPSTSFSAPVTLTSNLDAQGAPNPQLAVNQGGAAVIVWIDHSADSMDYAYSDNITEGTPPFNHIGSPAYSFQSYDFLSGMTVAIAGDGNAAVAWMQGGDEAPTEVNEADLPQATADSGGEFVGVDSASTGDGSGPLGSTYEVDPVIAMKGTTANGTQTTDNTVGLAFYDGADGDVVTMIRPGSDYEDGWEQLDPSPWTAANEGQDWIAEASTDTQQPQIALASSGTGDPGPLTMVWTNGDEVDSITSSAGGVFPNSATQLESGAAADSSCSGANNACATLASNPGSNLVALWQQNDAGLPNSPLEVAAACYQASATTTTANACDDLADPTTTSTTTTTTATTTTGSTTTTSSSGTENNDTANPASPQSSTSPTPPATVAQTIEEAPTTGTVLVELPGTHTFVNADTLPSIPNGSIIDATNGHVQLTFALPDGNTETAEFWAGEFQVEQSPDGAVDLSLVGGSFAGCPTPGRGTNSSTGHDLSGGRADLGSAAKTKPKKPGTVVRSLWSNAKGNYTTKGKNGSAAVLGTTWLTRDQCDGTYFYVRSTSNDPQGAIEVTVYHPHRHKVKLRRRHHLLAPAAG